MRKSLTPPILHIQYEKEKNEKSKGRLIQNPNYDIPPRPLHTSERAVLIERKALSHLIKPKWLGKGSLF